MRTDPELQPTNTANVFEDFFIVGAAANHFVPFGYEKEDAEVASPKLAPQSLFVWTGDQQLQSDQRR